MSNSDFEEKANRLAQRLANFNSQKVPPELPLKYPDPKELQKFREELEQSDAESRRRSRAFQDALRKVEVGLAEENDSRAKMGTFRPTQRRPSR